jgi:hypothetical protein
LRSLFLYFILNEQPRELDRKKGAGKRVANLLENLFLKNNPFLFISHILMGYYTGKVYQIGI